MIRVRTTANDDSTNTEVAMADKHHGLRIELDAVNLGIEWKYHFAAELKAEALKLAGDTGLITAEHYRQAAPAAISKLLLAINTPPIKDDAQRRAA